MIHQFYIEFFVRSTAPENEVRSKVLEALKTLITKYHLRYYEHKWERYARGKEIGLDLAWPDLEYGGMSLTIDLEEGGYRVSFSLDEVMLMEGEEGIFEKLIEFAKDFAVSVEEVEFGIAGFGWWLGQNDEDEFERLMQTKVLDHIPGGGIEVPPEGSEEFEKSYASYLYSFYPSFYVLNSERYEASKAFINNLPIQRVEELDNGGVLILVEYPLRYNIVRRLKKERHWLARGLEPHV